MVERLEVPGIVGAVTVVGVLASIGLLVVGIIGLAGDGIGESVGAMSLGAAVALFIATLLFSAIYEAIRDHGRFLAARLELIANQNNEVIRRLSGQEEVEIVPATPDTKIDPGRKLSCPKCGHIETVADGATPACSQCGLGQA